MVACKAVGFDPCRFKNAYACALTGECPKPPEMEDAIDLCECARAQGCSAAPVIGGTSQSPGGFAADSVRSAAIQFGSAPVPTPKKPADAQVVETYERLITIDRLEQKSEKEEKDQEDYYKLTGKFYVPAPSLTRPNYSFATSTGAKIQLCRFYGDAKVI